MVKAASEGSNQIAKRLIPGLFNLYIAEPVIISDKIAAREGIRVLDLHKGEKVIGILPCHRTLSVEQDAIGSAHDGHLRQVVGIVGIHRLA